MRVEAAVLEAKTATRLFRVGDNKLNVTLCALDVEAAAKTASK